MTLPPPGDPRYLKVEHVALFVYGTLEFPEVLQVLLGRVPTSEPASVPGWRVADIPGQIYAAMVNAEAIAHGRLITDLSGSEWDIIEAFEDEAYELQPLILSGGREAWAYVYADRNGVSAHDWDPDRFEQDFFVEYLKRCAAWRRIYEARPNEQ
jgi:gamma-glutamylcyclotransferase (GGCT)/AIG2-like uncharacterized protein YtfP